MVTISPSEDPSLPVSLNTRYGKILIREQSSTSVETSVDARQPINDEQTSGHVAGIEKENVSPSDSAPLGQASKPKSLAKYNAVENLWMPEKQTMDDIKEICKAVLLSPNVPAYKGPIVNLIVLAIMNEFNIGLPDGWQSISYLNEAIKSSIRNYLTETRANFKRSVMKYHEPVRKFDMEKLANVLFKKTSTSLCILISIEAWGRIAIMRKVANSCGSNTKSFWNNVDQTLSDIKSKAQSLYPLQGQSKGRALETSKQIRMILEEDYAQYGNPEKMNPWGPPPSLHTMKVTQFQEVVDRIASYPQSHIEALASGAMKRSGEAKSMHTEPPGYDEISIPPFQKFIDDVIAQVWEQEGEAHTRKRAAELTHKAEVKRQRL